MGIDLKILPQYCQDTCFSSDLISLRRDRELFRIISKLEANKGKELPSTFINKSIDTCYGTIIETPFGDVIKSVSAGELKVVLADYKPFHWRNKAFISFLNELPDDLKIWLYWC